MLSASFKNDRLTLIFVCNKDNQLKFITKYDIN